MKKLIAMIALAMTLSSCTGGLFSASVIDPFSDEEVSQQIITLANGTRVNITSDIDKLLNGESIGIESYSLQAKMMVRDTNTNAIQLINFPRLERLIQGGMIGTDPLSDIFSLTEDLVVEDEKTGLVWQKDATSDNLLMNYAEAVKYCKEFGESAYGKAFKVPKAEQLKTIIDLDTRAGIDIDKFDNLSASYWTNRRQESLIAENSGYWVYNFYTKNGEVLRQMSSAYVRCVGEIED